MRIAEPTQSSEDYEAIKSQRLQSRLWYNSGVEPRHRQKATLELSANEPWLRNLTKAEAAIDRGGLVFFLSETRGTGKTQCAAEIIRRACLNLMPSFYIRRRSIGMAIRECYRKDSSQSEIDVIRSFASWHLLVIDECQESPDTDFEQKALTHLIDIRYANQKPTIMIANCGPSEFKKLVGPSIYDRSFEEGGMILFDLKSFRRVCYGPQENGAGGQT